MPIEYIASKEIEPNPNYPRLKYLTLARDKDTKEYFWFLAENERPAMIDPERQILSETRTKDRLVDKRTFFSINNFMDFMGIKKETKAKK